MSKSKIITISVLFAFIIFVLLGWAKWRSEMYDLNHSEIAKQVEIKNLPFKLKIPTKVPFEEMLIFDFVTESENQVVIQLFNKHKDAIHIQITTNMITYKDHIQQKKVQIGKDLEGIFISNNEGKRILSWEDEGVFYEITYFPKITPKQVSKKQLIQMAESFK